MLIGFCHGRCYPLIPRPHTAAITKGNSVDASMFIHTNLVCQLNKYDHGHVYMMKNIYIKKIIIIGRLLWCETHIFNNQIHSKSTKSMPKIYPCTI